MKSWRERIKQTDEGKWQEYLRKDQIRNHQNRAKQKDKLSLQTNNNLLLEKRKKDRERQALCRLKKKEKMLALKETGNTFDSKLGTYKSPRTLGKAIKKVKNVLPKSPGKKQAVVKLLVESTFGNKLAKKLFQSKKSASKKLTEECKDTVIKFYNSDIISRQAPGKRDVKSPGIK